MNLAAAFTAHGKSRMQQRGIPPQIIHWLFEYGAVDHQTGATQYFFDKYAIRRISRDAGRQVVELLRKYFDVYAVVSEKGTVITTGWRNQHLRRDRKIHRRRVARPRDTNAAAPLAWVNVLASGEVLVSA